MQYISWDISRVKELVELWNKECSLDFPMREELFIQNSFQDLNINQEGSVICLNDQNVVVGFVIAKSWLEEIDVKMPDHIGWIQVLLVDSDYRRMGIGSTLLSKAEAALQSTNISKILLGRDPWHYFPGIPELYESVQNWFENRGYTREGKEADLICKTAYQEEVKLENVTFNVLQLDDRERFLSFLNRCFPGRWEYEAVKYFEMGGTGREFVTLIKNGDIIGFCRINDDQSPYIAQNVYWAPLLDERIGGIGPLGIDRNERKNGYGLAIVQEAIHQLNKRNIHTIVIDWTGLVNFYGKLHFNIWKEYRQYSKYF
ncbi:GNAT family N-acetyltransferase [Bacillus sp. 31A1R]|uniref:GNAT family N-acetyltransferase n=1 Tax=Robertmurraya mangrovi TaxID=3098077 RepID=A0ABU5J2Q5_9BACI|nr:GNAT family N-acetyltransferase [Bacillus sp. 31A1R]MDZ5473699.1 GNAT family N-acetyltransferase [Bacillus sp. 31A1R]